MAHAREEVLKKFNHAEVISRFIGATPDSINGQALLSGLCHQIARIYGLDETTIPTEYKKL